MPFCNHDGIRFHYRTVGTGVPFFFQHGLGAHVDQPFKAIKSLPGIRLIAFDCRGHGATLPLGDADKICLSAFADDLQAIMNHLEISAAFVGGISMGAAVAMSFAKRYSSRTLGLVISRPAWGDRPNPWNVYMFGLIAKLFRSYGAERGRKVFLECQEYADVQHDYPEAANSLLKQFDNPRLDDAINCLERIPRDSSVTNLAGWRDINIPTLVLANRLDPMHPFECGKAIASAIPGAEFKEITSKSVNVEQHCQDLQIHLESFLGKCLQRSQLAPNFN